MFTFRSTFGTASNIFRHGMFAQEANGSFHCRRQLKRRTLGLAHTYCRRFIFFERFVRARSNSSIFRFLMALRSELCTAHNIMIFLACRRQIRLATNKIRQIGNQMSARENSLATRCRNDIGIHGNNYQEQIDRIVHQCMCHLCKNSEANFNKNGAFLRGTRLLHRNQLVACQKERAARRYKCFHANRNMAMSIISRRRGIAAFIARFFHRNRANRHRTRAISQQLIRLTMCRKCFISGIKINRFIMRIIALADAFARTHGRKMAKILSHSIASRLRRICNFACTYAARRASFATLNRQARRISGFSTNFRRFLEIERLFVKQHITISDPTFFFASITFRIC